MIGKQTCSPFPHWMERKQPTLRYIAEIEALAIYQQCEDALDKTEMANCPTKATCNGINKATTDAGEKRLVNLYRQNTKLVATIVLGQASDYGLVVVQKTRTKDKPSGFAWKSIAIEV